MTQTENATEELAVGQLVRIADTIGWFWVTKLPEDPNGTIILYGGTVGRGGVYAKTRCVKRDRVLLITTVGWMRKAKLTQHAIVEALSAAPKVSSTRKPGKK